MEDTVKQKLDPEFKAKWIAALRSGEYKQGEGLLRSKDHEGKDCFCCLGVACVVAGSKSIPETEFIGDMIYEDVYNEFDNGSRYLPDGVPELLIGGNDTTSILSTMNDGDQPSGMRKHSFNEIADYIEANL